MQNIITEDFVTYSIKEWLLSKNTGCKIHQYHPPGGQANFGLQLQSDEIVFLDIIASINDDIFLFENKATYCKNDILKLLKISNDLKALNSVYQYVKRDSSQPFDLKFFHFFHGFGESKKIQAQNTIVKLAIVSLNGSIKISSQTNE